MDSSLNTSPSSPLNSAEIRVLAVLIEKSFITPDVYPLSLNALLTGCNQLTAREPVMNLSESDIQTALDSLMARRLVSKRDQAGARVAKYEHLIRIRYSLTPPEQAIIAILMLRGPQTAGEIRQRCERLHAFNNIEEVEKLLEHMAEKNPPLSCTLPLSPGTKEIRHMHMLGGEEAIEEASNMLPASRAISGQSRTKLAELESEINILRTELETLKAEFTQFRQQFD